MRTATINRYNYKRAPQIWSCFLMSKHKCYPVELKIQLTKRFLTAEIVTYKISDYPDTKLAVDTLKSH